MCGVKLLVKYVDVIESRGADNTYDPNHYLGCKLCGGVSDKGQKNRGIHHKGDCVVGRWELRQVIDEHRRHVYLGYAGGYHHSIWPNCGDEMGAENKRRSLAGLPSVQHKDMRISQSFN